MLEIMAIAQQYNLLVLEDCAQSHNASIDGKKQVIGVMLQDLASIRAKILEH